MSRVLRIFAVFFLPVPTAFGLVFYFFPEANLKTEIILYSFIFCYAFLLLWLYFIDKNPATAYLFVLLGMLSRLTALFALLLFLKIFHEDDMQSGLLIYLMSFFSFIIFEIIGLNSLHSSPGKKSWSK